VAAQSPRRRGAAAPKAPKLRTYVMASVRLDVPTHARVAAAAALAGMDKSTWMSRAITEALSGIVVFDRRSSKPDQVDSASEERSEDAA
jgi:hypothetical protein